MKIKYVAIKGLRLPRRCATDACRFYRGSGSSYDNKTNQYSCWVNCTLRNLPETDSDVFSFKTRHPLCPLKEIEIDEN